MQTEQATATSDRITRTLAMFDFDNTITTKDTFFMFFVYVFGWGRFLAGLVVLSPVLVLFKLKLMAREKAKEKVFSHFFRNMPLEKYNQLCESFTPKINDIVNQQCLSKIKYHLGEEHKVYIVSASVEGWIIPWARQNGITAVVATRAEVKNGVLTGKFCTKNCYGPEKVNRMKELYPDLAEKTVYAYGDSNGDTEMLAMAKHPFYRCF